MNDITKEQIQKLEKIGIAIADSISEDYYALNKYSSDNKKMINDLYSEFGRVLGRMNEVKIENEK